MDSLHVDSRVTWKCEISKRTLLFAYVMLTQNRTYIKKLKERNMRLSGTIFGFFVSKEEKVRKRCIEEFRIGSRNVDELKSFFAGVAPTPERTRLALRPWTIYAALH